MALKTLLRRLHLTPQNRPFSTSILSETPLTAKQKTRTAITLLKSETNPDRILQICTAASLSPTSHLDRVAFSRAIISLKNSHNFNAIATFLNSPANATLHHSLTLFGQAGMFDHAIRLFRSLPDAKRNTKALNSLLTGAILGKEYKELARVFTEFPGVYKITPDVETYNLVIQGFCEDGKSESGFSILAEMDRNNVKPNAATFARLIQGFYRENKEGEVDRVLGLMREKYKIKESLGIFNVRIKELCKAGKVDEAKEIYEGLVKRRARVNCVTYGELIHGFCKAGRFEEVKGLFRVMVNNGVSVGSDIYFTVVYYFCKGGDFEAALGFCKESMGKKWVPSFGIMKLLVDGLARSSKVDEAKELIKEMKEKFADKAEQWDEIEAALPQ